MFKSLPKSKAECKHFGEKYYFTGKECKNGHIDKRDRHGGCVSCQTMWNSARDQSVEGAVIGRPKGSKNKAPRGKQAYARRLEKRRAARLDTELKKEFKRLETEAYHAAKKAESIDNEKYVQTSMGTSKFYTDDANNRLAILHVSPDGFETHCTHKAIEHNYDLQRAEGKLDKAFDDGSGTARRLPKGSICQYSRENETHCIFCQKDNHPNNLSIRYDGIEKKYIPSLGKSI